MPAILFINGWRFFFYSNEGNEPIHVHAMKGEKECKYWLDSVNFDLVEAFSYKMTSRDKREVRKHIFLNFEYIEKEWDNFQKGKMMSTKKQHIVEDLFFEKDIMKVKIDGSEHSFELSKISTLLKDADKYSRETFVISKSGYGICWPLIDEDLSIDGLLNIQHSYPKLRMKKQQLNNNLF